MAAFSRLSSGVVRQPSGLSKVHGQITEKGARLVLGECRAAEAEVPEISVGQVLCLHTQRGRSAQHPEPVSATEGERGCWWGSHHVIDAGGIRSEVKDRDVRGEARQRGHRVTGVDRCRDNAVPHPTGFQLAPESLTRCGIVFSLAAVGGGRSRPRGRRFSQQRSFNDHHDHRLRTVARWRQGTGA